MEASSRQLHQKIECARAILEKAPAAGVDPAQAGAMGSELASLEIKFALSTSHLYVMAAADESGRVAATAEFARVLAAEDFVGEVDRLVARCEAALRAAGVALREDDDAAYDKTSGDRKQGGKGKPRSKAKAAAPVRKVPPALCAELQRLVDVYPRGSGAPPVPQRVDYTRCATCGVDMSTDAGRSELRCGLCGVVRELVGTVFDDSQFYSQEGQKAKSGTFNPNRHFYFWWQHILAREPEEELGDKDDPDNQYGEKLLEQLNAILARDRYIRRLVTVTQVRAMLRELNRTDLNKNVPLLMKKLTGVGPPQIPEAIAVRAENIFTKAIEIGERIRRDGRVNRNYYPFYIFRILEQLVPEADYENRRVLYYIYVQSQDTVVADDQDWELICDELTEIDYRPTDRHLGQQYAPV